MYPSLPFLDAKRKNSSSVFPAPLSFSNKLFLALVVSDVVSGRAGDIRMDGIFLFAWTALVVESNDARIYVDTESLYTCTYIHTYMSIRMRIYCVCV